MTELHGNGGLLQYYMLNTVINFLFNNFIALWRHLAKTQLLSLFTLYKQLWALHSSCVFARWRHSVMKFLNKKVNDCVQHIILQKSTNFHAIRSCSFRNICNEIWWQVAPFLRHPIFNKMWTSGGRGMLLWVDNQLAWTKSSRYRDVAVSASAVFNSYKTAMSSFWV